MLSSGLVLGWRLVFSLCAGLMAFDKINRIPLECNSPGRRDCEFIHGGCRYSAWNDTRICHREEVAGRRTDVRVRAIPNCDQGGRFAAARGGRTGVISSERLLRAKQSPPRLINRFLCDTWRLLRRPKAGRLAMTRQTLCPD